MRRGLIRSLRLSANTKHTIRSQMQRTDGPFPGTLQPGNQEYSYGVVTTGVDESLKAAWCRARTASSLLQRHGAAVQRESSILEVAAVRPGDTDGVCSMTA
jgi:hypothetical protein